MKSEGPYRVVQPVDITPLTVEGPTGNHGQMLQGGFLCNALNAAYAEGRKSAKKDLHYDELSLKCLVDRHESLVDDFKELLEWANDMAHEGRMTHNIEDLAERFYAWKKARGIE